MNISSKKGINDKPEMCLVFFIFSTPFSGEDVQVVTPLLVLH